MDMSKVIYKMLTLIKIRIIPSFHDGVAVVDSQYSHLMLLLKAWRNHQNNVLITYYWTCANYGFNNRNMKYSVEEIALNVVLLSTMNFGLVWSTRLNIRKENIRVSSRVVITRTLSNSA